METNPYRLAMKRNGSDRPSLSVTHATDAFSDSGDDAAPPSYDEVVASASSGPAPHRDAEPLQPAESASAALHRHTSSLASSAATSTSSSGTPTLASSSATRRPSFEPNLPRAATSAARPHPSQPRTRSSGDVPVAQSLADNPPPSFQRPPPPDAPYGPFPPATHYAFSDDLTQGFPVTPPTCACAPEPHPFLTHDVQEGDWARFLCDVAGAGGLKPVNELIADVAPTAVMVGIIGGYLASKALKAHVKSKRKSPVADVVELWNRQFFHPRCMDVVLAQGAVTYTGLMDVPPPDMPRESRKKNKHVQVIEDEGPEDHSRRPQVRDVGPRLSVVGDTVGALGDRLGRDGKAQKNRLEFGMDLRNSARERWRLVVAYKPPVL